METKKLKVEKEKLQSKQEARLLPRDRAMRRVS